MISIRKKDMRSELGNFLGLIIWVILYGATSLGYLGPNPVGQTSTYTAPLIIPAGYAFAIWSIIYFGLIAYPIMRWIKKDSAPSFWSKIDLLYVVNIIGNGLWLVAASYDLMVLTVIIITIMLWTLYRINDLMDQLSSNPRRYWTFALITFRIYLAWITLATALNISNALHQARWGGLGLSEITWTIIVSVIAALIAGVTAWRFKSMTFLLVVIWAFLALSVRHHGGITMIVYLGYAVILGCCVLLYLIYHQRSRERVTSQ